MLDVRFERLTKVATTTLRSVFFILPRTEYSKLEGCMAQHPPLMLSQERLWAGIIQFMR